MAKDLSVSTVSLLPELNPYQGGRLYDRTHGDSSPTTPPQQEIASQSPKDFFVGIDHGERLYLKSLIG